ncbi:MAG: PBECR2 nuclease fold domain-containing protein [Caulobacter sp.]
MTVVFRGRPAVEAIDYLQRKSVGGRFVFNWRDAWQEEHLHAQLIAKVTEREILEDVHGGLLKGAREGWSRQQFIDQLTPILQARGWWGRKRMTDPVTGAQVLAQLGSPRRLNTIYNVNMRMAHSAGRWERLQRNKADRPFLRYRHTPQPNPREQHQAWDGITLPVDHVFWTTHWCPNGWHCKCWTQSLRRAEAVTSEDELKRLGVYRTRTWRDKRTGRVVETPEGVDPGFGYNVGMARMSALAPPAAPEPIRPYVQGERQPAALPELPEPRPPPQGMELMPDLPATVDAVWEAFSAALGMGEGEVFLDRAQLPVVISRRMFEAHDASGASDGGKAALAGRARYAGLFAATLKDPDEIWHSMQTRQDGSSQLVRYYVAGWDSGDGRVWFLVSYHERDGVWWGTTAYGPGKRRSADNQRRTLDFGGRVGTLVYRRLGR